MYRRILNLLALCVLAGTAAATWYWSRPPEDTTAAIGPAAEEPPSYYLKDATLLETNEDGQVLYQIRAKFVEERPDDGALVADDVLLEWRESEAVPWLVKAGRAVLSVERRLVELERGVELVREPRDDGDVAVVRTERLVVEPDRHVARADGDVRLDVGASTLTAVGLEAFLQEDRLELEKDVRGAIRP
ncbi:MAG TPA: LPS export ABC transporter periplasmic protein LptC [Gammaproteobacteria bacterium]